MRQVDPVRQRGLSPLARGTLMKSSIKLLARRFIPAGAGNTANPQGPYMDLTVYPR
ncbi:hypothetical protein SEEHN653_21850, partial [Salmonella enterica subsp. enterica serovar Heidelberg str. N653]